MYTSSWHLTRKFFIQLWFYILYKNRDFARFFSICRQQRHPPGRTVAKNNPRDTIITKKTSKLVKDTYTGILYIDN